MSGFDNDHVFSIRMLLILTLTSASAVACCGGPRTRTLNMFQGHTLQEVAGRDHILQKGNDSGNNGTTFIDRFSLGKRWKRNVETVTPIPKFQPTTEEPEETSEGTAEVESTLEKELQEVGHPHANAEKLTIHIEEVICNIFCIWLFIIFGVALCVTCFGWCCFEVFAIYIDRRDAQRQRFHT